jgi:hypothetical protein
MDEKWLEAQHVRLIIHINILVYEFQQCSCDLLIHIGSEHSYNIWQLHKINNRDNRTCTFHRSYSGSVCTLSSTELGFPPNCLRILMFREGIKSSHSSPIPLPFINVYSQFCSVSWMTEINSLFIGREDLTLIVNEITNMSFLSKMHN